MHGSACLTAELVLQRSAQDERAALLRNQPACACTQAVAVHGVMVMPIFAVVTSEMPFQTVMAVVPSFRIFAFSV